MKIKKWNQNQHVFKKGVRYYHNRYTNESSWERPKGGTHEKPGDFMLTQSHSPLVTWKPLTHITTSSLLLIAFSIT